METRFRAKEPSPHLSRRPPVDPAKRQRGFSPRIPSPLQVAWGSLGAAVLLVIVLGVNMIVSQGSSTSTIPIMRTPTPLAVQRVAVPTTVAASGLTAHACIRYNPLHGNQHHVVFIDPGHGGVDTGTSGPTTTGKKLYEKNVTLAVALATLPILRDQGYTVVLSRNADTLVSRTTAADFAGTTLTASAERKDAQARVACANSVRAEALIIIHLNAYADPTTNGAETVYDGSRSFHAASERLADLIQRDVVSQFRSAGWPVPDNGVTDDRAAASQAPTAGAGAEEHLLELGPSGPNGLQQPSTMPGALAEPLFITHPAEADVAIDPKGVHAMAAGLAEAVGEFFGSKVPAGTATP